MLLSSIFFLLFLGLFVIFFIPRNNIAFLRSFSVCLSGIILILSCLIFVQFNSNDSNIQFLTNFDFLSSKLLNINFSLGLDGISIYFFVLTSLLIFLCVIFVWGEVYLKSYLLLLFLIEIALLFTFSTLNLFLFYVFFEFILIPMYLLLGIWGS